MSNPILVAYDATSSNRAPVTFGVAAARCVHSPLMIVCVYGTAAARDLLGAAQVAEDRVADASETLDDVVRELQASGIRVEFRGLGKVHPTRALHATARAEEAGLLVVGSPRRETVGHLLPRSIVERQMQGALCPVAVVPYGWAAVVGRKTIGVDYVDSSEGHEALRGAHALARRVGGTLYVVIAVSPGSAGALEGELRALAEGAQRSAIATLGGDVAVHADVFAEDPADVLVRASENLDLLVCGSRGYGPPSAVSLGKVSRRVATEAGCPVVVVPRGGGRSLEALVTRGEAPHRPDRSAL
jgi:nucleotide-binding universal stress UspA family protein